MSEKKKYTVTAEIELDSAGLDRVISLSMAPSLSMRTLAVTSEAVFLRLPPELQRDIQYCTCPVCEKDPSKAKWDTLVVPLDGSNTHTIHLPDESVADLIQYIKRRSAPIALGRESS